MNTLERTTYCWRDTATREVIRIDYNKMNIETLKDENMEALDLFIAPPASQVSPEESFSHQFDHGTELQVEIMGE